MKNVIGIFETRGYAAALAAAESILEESRIKLIKIEKAGSGIISLFFQADDQLMKKAFSKGLLNARDVGEITAMHIAREFFNGMEKFLNDSDVSTLHEKSLIKMRASSKLNSRSSIKPFNAGNNYSEEKTNKTKELKANHSLKSDSTIQRLRQEALGASRINIEEKEPVTSSKKNYGEINMNKIEKLNVQELRREARRIKNFPIQGREISRANRKELINFFKDII